jgi:hypothetical protein
MTTKTLDTVPVQLNKEEIAVAIRAFQENPPLLFNNPSVVMALLCKLVDASRVLEGPPRPQTFTDRKPTTANPYTAA